MAYRAMPLVIAIPQFLLPTVRSPSYGYSSVDIVCDPPRKMKHPQSSSENRSADGENHLDMSLEEEEISDMSPKKSLEVGDGSKLYKEPYQAQWYS